MHFLIVADGDLNADGRPVTVIASKSAITDEEEGKLISHLIQNKNLFAVYSPLAFREPENTGELFCGGGDASCPREHNQSLKKVSGQRVQSASALPFASLIEPNATLFPQRTLANYPYNISPVYDSNPFFFFTLKTGDVLKKIFSNTGRGMDWRINLGVTVLFMVFAISIVAVLLFLILPLWWTTARVGAAASAAHRQARAPAAPLLYFIFVGLGFILVEIALIQRFVLFLGHPTYALTVVVFLMLLASGAGSFISKRVVSDSARVWIPLVAIALGIVLYRFALPAIIAAGVGLPFAVKLAISAGLLIPLGLLMGMPFPTGLRALSERNDGRVEWAWALNAAASVLGSVSAMIIAIHFGLNVTLLCGAAAYLLAAVTRVR
jgi:hypothetical protein